jgi:hypothetical protein
MNRKTNVSFQEKKAFLPNAGLSRERFAGYQNAAVLPLGGVKNRKIGWHSSTWLARKSCST